MFPCLRHPMLHWHSCVAYVRPALMPVENLLPLRQHYAQDELMEQRRHWCRAHHHNAHLGLCSLMPQVLKFIGRRYVNPATPTRRHTAELKKLK